MSVSFSLGTIPLLQEGVAFAEQMTGEGNQEQLFFQELKIIFIIMMKLRFKYLIFFTVVSIQLIGQVNLVPNPSLETHTACPSVTGLCGCIYMATNWNNYLGTCDYFNTCATNPDGHVPKNFAGNQNAYSGNAYGSILTYEESGGDWREIIGVKLLNPLIVSQKYYVSFRLSRAEAVLIAGYSTNKMGVKLSVNYIQATVDNNPKFIQTQ